jgi:hypothetical protein
VDGVAEKPPVAIEEPELSMPTESNLPTCLPAFRKPSRMER